MLSRRRAAALLGAPVLGAQSPPAATTAMFGNANAYERFMGRWSALLAPMLAGFAHLPAAGEILDIGSGTGALAFSIARARPRCRVTGIDPSAEYTGFAAARNPFGARVRFETGDARHLHFADAAFHASVSLLVWNFIPEPALALAEAVRVTRPGGAVAAAVWDYGEGMKMLRTFWDSAVAVESRAERLDERHMPLCRAGELKALWKQGGLESVEERPLTMTMRFASFPDFWDPFLLGQGPAGAYLKSLDGGRAEPVRREALRRLGIAREDAPFSLGARAWAVCGVKPGRG